MMSYVELKRESERLAYVYRGVYGTYPGEVIQQLVDAPQVTYAASTNGDSWRIIVKVYDRVRWLQHLEKCPLPSRKLRKCHLCKRLKRLQRDKKRYERRYV